MNSEPPNKPPDPLWQMKEEMLEKGEISREELEVYIMNQRVKVAAAKKAALMDAIALQRLQFANRGKDSQEFERLCERQAFLDAIEELHEREADLVKHIHTLEDMLEQARHQASYLEGVMEASATNWDAEKRILLERAERAEVGGSGTAVDGGLEDCLASGKLIGWLQMIGGEGMTGGPKRTR